MWRRRRIGANGLRAAEEPRPAHIDLLPNDVLSMILDLVSLNKLLQLALSNKTLAAIAEARLCAVRPLLSMPFALSMRFTLAADTHTVILRLSSCSLNDSGMDAIARACLAGALPQCISLELRDNGIGDSGIGSFCTATRHGVLPSLTSLDLSHNAYGEQSHMMLADTLTAGGMRNLQNLHVDGPNAPLALRAASDARQIQLDVVGQVVGDDDALFTLFTNGDLDDFFDELFLYPSYPSYR